MKVQKKILLFWATMDFMNFKYRYFFNILTIYLYSLDVNINKLLWDFCESNFAFLNSLEIYLILINSYMLVSHCIISLLKNRIYFS